MGSPTRRISFARGQTQRYHLCDGCCDNCVPFPTALFEEILGVQLVDSEFPFVANHTIDTKGWLWAFQLLVQSILHCHPCQFWVDILFSRLASPKMVREKEWNAKTWCLWICCHASDFLLAKVHLKFCGFKSAKTSFLGRNQKFGGPMDDQYSFRCWTKITLFVVLLVILISDSIPSYGHTCSFVAGVDAKHIRFGFIADEIQQAPHHSIEPTDLSRVNFPNLTTSLRNLSLREWSFFFGMKKSHFTPLLGKEHSFRLWKWQVTFLISRCCRRSFAKWTSRKGQGPGSLDGRGSEGVAEA